MNDIAIRGEQLRKIYRGSKDKVAALDGLDLEVPTGKVYGLLGPNGAGKTTAVRVFATLLRPDGGRALVAGLDVVRQAPAVRARIGLIGQHAAVDEILSGKQNLEMFGRLYHLGARAARQRADELLRRFDLADTGSKPVKSYSGGMRRRLDLAAGLITRPPVLFLDEPTTGLDPRGRIEVWTAVRGLVRDGATVLLTTQYLEEADELADWIAVIDHGRLLAEGTPDMLKTRVGNDRLEVVVRSSSDAVAVEKLVSGVIGATDGAFGPSKDGLAGPSVDGLRVTAVVEDRVAALTAVAKALEEKGIAVEDIGLRRPTLDDVFLQLTGHAASEEPEASSRTEKEKNAGAGTGKEEAA